MFQNHMHKCFNNAKVEGGRGLGQRIIKKKGRKKLTFCHLFSHILLQGGVKFPLFSEFLVVVPLLSCLCSFFVGNTIPEWYDMVRIESIDRAIMPERCGLVVRGLSAEIFPTSKYIISSEHYSADQPCFDIR